MKHMNTYALNVGIAEESLFKLIKEVFFMFNWCAREYRARKSCRNYNSYGVVCERGGKCGRIFLFGHLIGNRWMIFIIIIVVLLICLAKYI